MKCPKCGYDYCDIIADTHTRGSDFSICGALFGEILFGTDGFCCGFCSERNINVESYWKCKKCGYKFKK